VKKDSEEEMKREDEKRKERLKKYLEKIFDFKAISKHEKYEYLPYKILGCSELSREPRRK